MSVEEGAEGNRQKSGVCSAVLLGAPLKETFRRFAQGFFEDFWALHFRWAKRLWPAERRILVIAESGHERRVLVVSPHPDDEVVGCAGAILAHRQAGHRVDVLCVTDGRRSTAYGLGQEEMARRRENEAKAAAQLLDVDLCWLAFPEGDWDAACLREALAEALASYRPDLVYAPSALDFHPEHRRVAKVLAEVLLDVEPSPLLRIYEIQVPLLPSPANVVLPDVSRAAVEAALRCHITQLGSIQCSLRRRRYAASLAGLRGYAEVFWELDAESYARLHEDPPAASAFRSLRYWALSDPLAYLQGRRERRRSAKLESEGAA